MKSMKTNILSFLFAALFLFSAFPAMAREDAKGPILTLEQAHRMALQNNPGMRNIGETMRQADILIYKAWAILLPNLSASGKVTRNSHELSMEFPNMDQLLAGNPNPDMVENKMSELWNQEYGFTANMSLFNARSIPLLMNAYDNIDQTAAIGRHQKNELLFAVTQSFYMVKSAMELVEVNLEALENAKAFHRMAKAQQAVGQAVRIDVLRSEIAVMEAEKGHKNAKDSLKLARTALSYLIGYKGNFEIETPPEVRIPEAPLKELTDKALHERLDLKQANLLVTMADRDRIETFTKWVPVFDITYNWTWNSMEDFTGQNDSWRLIFGLNWSILEGGMKIAEASERASKMRQARNTRNQLRLNVKEEVEKNRIELSQYRNNVEISEKQFLLAEETHRLVEKQYENGMATSLDLLDAQTTLARARSGRIIENLNYNLAALRLNKATGEVSPSLAKSSR